MTKLVKLILKNFKSFKKAEIPIGKGFTAIVGSNGSGKSNVLDALLFVLGITSLKTLRAAKLTDLVNSDSKENYAKVDLIIKDDNKSYELSRMVDKQGKSVYRLDGKRTTLNEINSLLVDLGIDISGHNIVTQGDITNVVNMSAIERREIIDNIAGLSEFDEKKDEALKELGKVDSRIKEATIIMNERTNFLEEMEKEMNAAKEYEALEKERKEIKATIISKELYSIEKRNNELDNERKELENMREEIEKNLENLKKELFEAKEKSKELSKEAMKGSEEIYDKIGKAYESKKGLLALEKERVNAKEENVNKNKEKVKVNNSFIENSKIEKKELNDKKKEIEKSIKEIDFELKDVSKKKSELEKVVSEKNNEIRKVEFDLDEKNKEVENFRKEVFDLEVFVKQWDKQKAFNQKKLIELENENKEIQNAVNELSEKKKKLKVLKDKNIEKFISEKERKIEEISDEISEIRAINNEEEKAINELKKEISKCPVCDSNLDKERKNKILESKNMLVEKNFNLLEGKKEKLAIEKEELNELKEELKLKERIEMEVESLIDSEKKLSENKIKINKVKEELDEKAFEAQISKRNKIDAQMKALFEKRDLNKNKLKSLREQNIFENFTTISKQQEELIHNKSLFEKQLNDINSRLELINSREESLLIENEELSIEIKENSTDIEEKKPMIVQMEREISGKEKELEKAKKENEGLVKEKDKLDSKIESFEKEIISESNKSRKAELRINEFNIEKSKLEVKQIDLEEEAKLFEDVETIGGKNIEELKERIIEVNKKLEDIGAVNMKAVQNFTELKKEVDEIQQKANKLEEERLAVLDMIDKIDVKRTNVFMECFNEVNKNFQDMFSKFFNGEGLLDLTDPNNPLESGLIIDAKPKGGKLQNIDSMSGGEKTLTALAFMFAIQLYSPAPFYAFDEADAALDKENSLKMGNLIEKIAEKSQFIAITHNDTITKKADQIIGVALNKDQSSVIGLKLKKLENAN